MPPKKAVAAVAAVAAPTKRVTRKAPQKSPVEASPVAKPITTVKKSDLKSAEKEPPKKAAPKKAAPKKAAPKKAAPKTAVSKKTAPKTAAPKTTVSKKTATDVKPLANMSKKRQAEEAVANHAPEKKAKVEKAAATKRKAGEGSDDEPIAKKVKKGPTKKAVTTEAAPAKKPAVKIGIQINFAPTQPLDVFVFGEGSSGELGLGNKVVDGKAPIDVKRPRLNHNLSAAKVGVVQIACGGMHSVALTKQNKIITWGVNDQGALGRDTTWDGGLRDADADNSDSDSEDGEGMNPIESTPAEVDTKNIAPGTKFVKVVASDSASFALTEDGRVYGWGTFRSSDGILGFSKDILVQKEPVLLPEPKKIVDIAAGSNHVMILNDKGKLETWGAAEQNQLGRRVVQRDMRASALRPGGVAFRRGIKIAKVACGSYHSFAVDNNGRVYAWGLNNFGELGVENMAGEEGATVLEPTLIERLADYKISDISGGEHHSLACSEDGQILTWGRIDGYQTGFPADMFTEQNAIFDDHNKPRILKVPTAHKGLPAVKSVAAGTDNSFAITHDGKAYSWGFNANYQCGQGKTEDDIEVPTLIENSAVREKELVFAGAGGQFSVLASVHKDEI